MKTKTLIKLLQEADPTGEEEVCVGNQDILCVEQEPAYYDGCLQVLERDESKECYNVTGVRYVRDGNKISITPYGVVDAIWDNPEVPVDCIGIERYEEKVAKTRADVYACLADIESKKEAEK
jgi:hypothetical protein